MDLFDRKAESGSPPRRRVAAEKYALGVASLLAIAGCSQAAVATVPETTVDAPAVVVAPVPQPGPTGPAAAVAAVEKQADGHSGTIVEAAVLDRATRELALGRNAAQPLYAASLSKLIVAVDVLQQGNTGLTVTDEVRDLIGRSLGPSDDDAMNALWSDFDGPGAVSRVAAQLGLQDTFPPVDVTRWGETLVSARDVVRLYDFVLTDLPTQDRDFILGTLAGAPTRAVDGFELAFGLAVTGAGAVKSAWMCCPQGTITLHSAGVMDQHARHFVVALLSSQPSSLGYAKARDELTDAAQAALATLR